MNLRLDYLNKTKCKRVVIKVGTNFICNNQNAVLSSKKENIKSINEINLKKLCSEIISLREKNIQVMLVTSGAVFTGKFELKNKGINLDNTLEHRQAYSAIGQSILMSYYQEEFQKYNIPLAQLLLTANDFIQRRSYLNIAQTINALLELETLAIVNENDTVATEELQFGENDLLSAACASIFKADYLCILTTIEGFIYENKRLDFIEKIEEKHLEQAKGPDTAGRGGMQTKLKAANLCALSGIHCAILPGFHDRPISSFLPGRI